MINTCIDRYINKIDILKESKNDHDSLYLELNLYFLWGVLPNG